MKTQWLLGLALCAATLGTQAQTSDESVRIPAPRLTIELPERHSYVDPRESREFRGTYELSNGQLLTLTAVGNIMYGEVGEQGRHRMVATRHNTFVALDRKLQVRIDRGQDGETSGEVLVAVPMRIAETGEIGEHIVRLAAR
ncbi:hypothetical protein SAMN05216319_3845 [Duganella sp. CF402]|uniref:hypothetical protein n=1 Tax=unclassified Duganella TaxID=2636909 RepID=UPI0008C2EDDB|nr:MULTISPECIES: hypothetical protein [unclassified Duganella]RZT04373.1 hypothetical protein EV582_5260 [Duganella sp. BK701]SEM38600.1 hypothetical protein SAMN05216319_3845 [Duganella sp. CF402]